MKIARYDRRTISNVSCTMRNAIVIGELGAEEVDEE